MKILNKIVEFTWIVLITLLSCESKSIWNASEYSKHSNNSSEISNRNRLSFVWLPNNEGFFANFLALRVILYSMRQIGPSSRLLIIPPRHTTMHFSGNKSDEINLCRILSLPPSQVLCPSQNKKTARELCKCDASVDGKSRTVCLNADKLLLALQDPVVRGRLRGRRVCYRDSYVPLPALDTHREVTLRAVEMQEPPFVLHDQYVTAAEAFEAALQSLGPPGGHYAVVHWRRGDQLSSRCSARQAKDRSVNCQDAAALHLQVLRTLRALGREGLPVYVATNEPPGSQQLRILRQLGYLLLGDVLRAMPPPQALPFLRPCSLSAFLLEVALMLRAPLFLAWGVSEVDDVVERERSVHNRSWCAAYNASAVQYPTWCWWRRELRLGPIAPHPATLQLPAFVRELQDKKKRAGGR